MGVPRELKGQQNVKHSQLYKGEEETPMICPLSLQEGDPSQGLQGYPEGHTRACTSEPESKAA